MWKKILIATVLLSSVPLFSQAMDNLKKTIAFVYGTVQTKDKNGKASA
jgi:hypothetical protein